jgi:hypothetical protein
MKNINDFELSEKVTVGQARKWMADKDENSKDKLINLLHHRFTNRYVKHLSKTNSGFLKMAISCLMIETLESFKQGQKDTKRKSQKMFEDFFETEEKYFPGFKDISIDFFKSIRCGILHQAETTNAWRILRKNALLDKSNRTINATKFVKALEKSLENYIDTLRTMDFNSTIWERALIKIEDVCENCNAVANILSIVPNRAEKG